MKNVKNDRRERLTDKHLADILRVATSTIEVDIDSIVNSKQTQTSHYQWGLLAFLFNLLIPFRAFRFVYLFIYFLVMMLKMLILSYSLKISIFIICII